MSPLDWDEELRRSQPALFRAGDRLRRGIEGLHNDKNDAVFHASVADRRRRQVQADRDQLLAAAEAVVDASEERLGPAIGELLMVVSCVRSAMSYRSEEMW